jgi:hypothetical protein
MSSDLYFISNNEKGIEREKLIWKKAIFGLDISEIERLKVLLNEHCDNLDPNKFNVELIRSNALKGL